MTEIIFLLTEEIALFSSVLGLIVIVVAVNYLLYEKYCAEPADSWIFIQLTLDRLHTPSQLA